jgi:ABC-2 type transport system permease protein
VAWQFVTLKLRLMAGALRGSPARLAGLIVAGVAGLYAMPAAFALLAALHGREVAAGTGVLVFTAVAVNWALLPLFAFGTDETLDPARLALLPLRRRTLTVGLFAAALTGIGPVVTFVVLLGVVAAVADSPGSVAVGVLAAALNLALCVTASRALTTGFSRLLRSRRGSDAGLIAGALLVAVTVVAGNIALRAQAARGGLGREVDAAAGIARWTPPGMLAHAIGDAARGAYPLAFAGLAAGAVSVLALLWAWVALLGHALTSQDGQSRGARRRSAGAAAPAAVRVVPAAGSAAAAVPHPPAGVSRARAVAAKELRYTWRDPRRRAAWLGLATALLITLSAAGLATDGLARSSGAVLAVAACYPGVLAGVQAANQFGLDGGALWLNVAATWRARQLRADLAGKNLACALVAVPFFTALYAALGLAVHQVRYPAAGLGLSIAALGVSLGIASIASVLLPYPVPDRRASAFGGGGTGRGCLAALTSAGILVLAALLLSPLLAALATLHAGPWLLVAGPSYGAAVAWAGRAIASGLGYRRLPELLAEVSRTV